LFADVGFAFSFAETGFCSPQSAYIAQHTQSSLAFLELVGFGTVLLGGFFILFFVLATDFTLLTAALAFVVLVVAAYITMSD
jgi:hypothetical protein